MGTSLTTLIAQTRLESSLRNNRYYSNEDIAGFLTEGFWSLRDLMIAKFAHWFRSTYDFTLTGGNDGNSINLVDSVPDLEMIQGLFLVDASGNLTPVTMMSSISEIGSLNVSFPFSGDDYSYRGTIGRKYFPDGDILTVYPGANSAGNYRLFYTPRAQRFEAAVTVEFEIDAADLPMVPPPGGLDGEGAWLLQNAFEGIDQDTVPSSGFDLVLTFTPDYSPPYSGTYPVTDVGKSPSFGSPTFAADNLTSTAGFTNPASGTGTYTYQPIGTISELPENLTQWQRYLVLYASIMIRQGRRQPFSDLELQFQQIEKRISALTKQRSEGVRQAPISRGRRRGFDY